MRDPKRIPRIINKLSTLWQCVPEMRLLQLMYVLESKLTGDPFYVEDHDVEKVIDDLIASFQKEVSNESN